MRRALFVFCLALAPVLVFAQSADQEILSVTDSPDPAVPGDNITYTVTIRNNGPDAATNGGMNALIPNLNYVSASGPAGFSCSAFGQAVSCTHPAFPSGTTAIFTLVAQLPASLISFPDGSVSSSFSTSGTTPDPVPGNNNDTESTAYNTPQIDIALSVTDSPDPVFPNGTITYTVPVANNGPDTGTSAQFSTFNNGTLRFQSATVPAGWSCTLPSVGGNPTFSCTKPTFANGATDTFTIVVLADPAILGVNDGTVSMVFNANATGNETNNANNIETEDTAYTTPDADMAITVSDSPDPVFPDGNITYTVQVTNNGPDTATNATLNTFNNGTLKFQSATVPAGWNCTLPAVNAAPSFTCTNPSFANGASSTFTIVALADDAVLGINDGTVSTAFTAGSGVSDPNNANNAETEDTAYVTPDADMALTVSDSPDPVTPDNNITYTVQVTNNGPDTATNATLNVFNNGTLKYQSASVPAGWNCTLPAVNATPTFTCTNPSFANGASSTFTIVALADDGVLGINDGTISTAFTIGSGAADPNNTNNSETEDTAYVTPDADLSVTNSDSPDPVTSGGTITYTQTITNNGPDAAPDATLTQVLPGSVGFQSIAAPGGFTCTTPAVGASGTITCTNPSLANGASGTFTLVVTVLAASGTVTNTVVSSSDIQDPDNTDNSATVTTTILAPVIADLAIAKSTNSTNTAPGSTLTYTITLTNNGPDDATNVVVTDTLPSSLLFQSIVVPAGFTCITPAAGASGTITCNAATFVNGATATFTLIVEVASNATGSINNTATATSDTDDNTPGNGSGSAGAVTVGGTATADLAVTKTTTTTEADPGDTVSYTISVTNSGPGTADDIVVTDDLPVELLFQSITPAAGFTCATPPVGSSGTILCTGGSLANGATATFTLVATVAPSATGSIVNGASVGTSDSDPDPGDSSTTSPGIVMESADLSITKSTPATSAPTGSTLTYTITISNAGPDAATNVVVTDDLPAGLQFVSATPSQGTCNASDPVTCNLGGLAIGGSATITIQALVTATSGTITNTADVSATEDDPNPGNNGSSSPPIPVVPAAAPAAAIPTMSEWALIALAAMLGLVAIVKMRS